MSKIYALYFNEEKLEMKISSEKCWERQKPILEECTDSVMRYNGCTFLSFSRAALVEKAQGIKNYWLNKQYERISKIANIELKR